MSGGKRKAELARRASLLAFGLILDLSERLDEAGVPPECAPSLEAALDLVWDLSVALARLEMVAENAGRIAASARSRLLDVVTEQHAGARLVPVPGPGKPGAGTSRLLSGDWKRWESEIGADESEGAS